MGIVYEIDVEYAHVNRLPNEPNMHVIDA